MIRTFASQVTPLEDATIVRLTGQEQMIATNAATYPIAVTVKSAESKRVADHAL